MVIFVLIKTDFPLNGSGRNPFILIVSEADDQACESNCVLLSTVIQICTGAAEDGKFFHSIGMFWKLDLCAIKLQILQYMCIHATVYRRRLRRQLTHYQEQLL